MSTSVEFSEDSDTGEFVEVPTSVYFFENIDMREAVERLNNRRASLSAYRNRLNLLNAIFLTDVVLLLLAFGARLTLRNRLCHRAPGLALKDFAVREMAVFHIVNSTSSTPWQVSSDIDITLTFWNRNKVPGCFTTLLRMEVSLYYAGNTTISVSNLPLEFSLKAKRSLSMSAQLQGERFLITNHSAGSALAADLRRENITLQLAIGTRYVQSNGLLQRIRTFCEVVASTPLESNSRPTSLLRKKCVDM